MEKSKRPFEVIPGGRDEKSKMPHAMLSIDGQLFVGEGRKWKKIVKPTQTLTGAFSHEEEEVTDPELIGRLHQEWKSHLILEEVPKE